MLVKYNIIPNTLNIGISNSGRRISSTHDDFIVSFFLDLVHFVEIFKLFSQFLSVVKNLLRKFQHLSHVDSVGPIDDALFDFVQHCKFFILRQCFYIKIFDIWQLFLHGCHFVEMRRK